MDSSKLSQWISELGLWPLIGILVLNLVFRRYGKAAIKKRMACLYQALAVFAITSIAAVIAQKELGDLYLYIGTLAVVAFLYIFKAKTFPYRLTCLRCSKKLDMKTIYFMDNNLCPKCQDMKTDGSA